MARMQADGFPLEEANEVENEVAWPHYYVIKHNMRLTWQTCARCASSLISIRRPNVWPMSERSTPTFHLLVREH